MSTPSLPDLPPDIAWLITMAPTREALDAYLTGHPPAGTDLGAHITAFMITNVFTADPGLSRAARYSLLSSPSSTAPLRVSEPGRRTLMTEVYSDDEIAQGISISYPYKQADGTFITRTEKDFPAQIAAAVKDLQDLYNDYRKDIWTACKEIHATWKDTLRRYGVMTTTTREIRRIPEYLVGAPCHNPLYNLYNLYNEQHPSLPPINLLDDLCLGYCLGEILLLTARHELGCIYLRAKAWYDRAHEQGFADPDDLFLDRDTWELLSARAGGYRYWTISVIADDARRARRDTPINALDTVSDLARLYGEMATWCKDVYKAVVTLRRCQRNGCLNTLLPHTGPGQPRKYCSEACDKRAQQEKSAKRARVYRHKINAEGLTPYQVKKRRHAK